MADYIDLERGSEFVLLLGFLVGGGHGVGVDSLVGLVVA